MICVDDVDADIVDDDDDDDTTEGTLKCVPLFPAKILKPKLQFPALQTCTNFSAVQPHMCP